MQQLKRRILKKLEIATYDDKLTQQSLRLFSIKGIEYYDYDSINQLKEIKELYYSFGEDYNYTIRLNTLKLIKELGQGGFGTVFLMHDQLLGFEVAVKFINFRQKNGNCNTLLM